MIVFKHKYTIYTMEIGKKYNNGGKIFQTFWLCVKVNLKKV